MVPSEELIFLATEDLLAQLRECSELANRETAHERADEIMVICLLRAADPQEEFSSWDAAEAVRHYHAVDKFYA